MLGLSLLSSFTRLSLKPSIHNRSISTFKVLQFRATPCLCAEPLKKKKRMDPAIIRQREERRKRKIEKQIKRLEKNARQLKPIDEVEIPVEYVDEKAKRSRPALVLSTEEIDYRSLLEKTWAREVTKERVADIKNIDRIVSAQRRALKALREESEDLYEEAIMPDMNLMTYVGQGPVATPPIKSYETPDGEYIDVSKDWTSV